MRGLVRFNGNDINDYHKVESIDRLDISHINSVCEGAGGRIWFATNNSLGYVNPVDEEASLFLSNDATPMHSFIAGVSYADNDGVISFPSINGLIRVNSRAVDSFDEPLDVHVTSFVSFSEDSSAKGLEQMLGDGTVRLRHDENDFTVTFSIPDYAHMLYADFSYRLDGFDDIWHEIMGDNTVSFHSIQPGEYKLQVRRRSDGDSWSLPQQVLTVIIEPSPWLTWWAKLIYVLLALAFCAVVAYLLKHRIDARRLYLQEKEHSRNAQELNEERLRFYTNVTHELRTPLTLIMGPLEDLVSDPSLPSKYAYKLRMMRSNAESLLTLINGILEFRKTETLNRQLTVRRGPVANLVREIGLRFKESTQNQKLRFVFDIEDNSPEIYYDNDIVTIVLNNLLSNAVKYTPEGEIRLSLHTVSDDKGVRRTVIAVSDTGYGISGKALNLIFQRYFQANGEHQASGTGIGLALVKNLADLHHATIEVQSVEGKGSTFSLSLLTDESYPEALHFDEPQAGVEDRGAGHEVADDIQCVDGQENTPPERRRILVVEDNADIREYIRLTLQEEAEVSTAVNGLDGLEKAFSIIPDLIISDIMMPEMDGVTMCRQLKGEEVTSHIPIVLLTAKDSLTDKEEGYESGADSYLTKPFSAKLLRSRIHNILMTRKRLAAYLMSRSEGHVISDEETVTPDEEEKKIVEQSLSPLDAHFLEKLNNILSDNIADDALNVTLLADKMCMSNSTLYRKLMSLLGVSPNEYIRRLRLKHATELLNKRELSIEEIAFRTGFGSYNTFSKVFKKEFGLSPTEYIKKNIVKQTGG